MLGVDRVLEVGLISRSKLDRGMFMFGLVISMRFLGVGLSMGWAVVSSLSLSVSLSVSMGLMLVWVAGLV